MTISQTENRLVRGKRVGVLALLGVLAFSPQAVAATKVEVMKMVSDEAIRNGRVPVALALAVARIESNFNDQAISPVGARGVMQMMPATAMGEFGVPKDQLLDPRLNVKLGVAYLERLYNQYGQDWELALSHYNGGSLRISDGRFVSHNYTRQYVSDVLYWAHSYQVDGTAVTLANGTNNGGGVQLAMLDEGKSFASYSHQAKPNWQEIQSASGTSVDEKSLLSDRLAQSTRELSDRFRANLNSRGEVNWERYTEQPARPVEVRREGWPVETFPAQQYAPTQAGRFNYAPFGRGHFL